MTLCQCQEGLQGKDIGLQGASFGSFWWYFFQRSMGSGKIKGTLMVFTMQNFSPNNHRGEFRAILAPHFWQ